MNLMVQIIDTSGGNRIVRQTTWISVDTMLTAQIYADKIVDVAPAWLGGDTVEINQEGRVLRSRSFDTGSWRA